MFSSLVRSVLVVAALSRVAVAQCGTWNPSFGAVGVTGHVASFLEFDDGSGRALYVGGDFNSVEGNYTLQALARWNGTSWSALRSGPGTNVSSQKVFDDGSGPALYAAGYMPGLGGVAKWNGSSWSGLGTGVSRGLPSNASVFALEVFDDGSGPALFAGGSFTTAGGASASSIAKWNGSSWSALGFGLNGTVSALQVFDDGSGPALYVAGNFSNAGGTAANRIAKWNGTVWSALGSGLNNFVSTLHVHDDGSGPALFAGGSFTQAGGVTARGLAKWNGASWSEFGGGVGGSQPNVFTIQDCDDGSGPALYIGGQFTAAGGTSANRIARWNGSSWSPLGSGADHDVLAIQSFDAGSGPLLFVGGGFLTAGGVTVNELATWNGNNWGSTSTGKGISGASQDVRALQAYNGGSGLALYAGGDFYAAGTTTAHSLAKWNGTSWSTVGGGIDGTTVVVNALLVFNDGSGESLFVGGDFASAGGTGVNRIAKWNGSTWSGLGTGLFGRVNALSAFDAGTGPALYAGGDFPGHIQRWNGASWSALGVGVDTQVQALQVFDDGSGPALYVGGGFTTAGGAPAKYVAKWNGSTWSPLGSGLNNTVLALAVYDDGSGPALYAGGWFTVAGGSGANHIAKWNGSTWSSLGVGVDSRVHSLKVYDDGSGPILYVGGEFTMAGGTTVDQPAKWNGTTWSGIGGGINAGVNSMAVMDDGLDASADLFVGGQFAYSNGLPSYSIAERHGCGTQSFCFGDGSTVACPCSNNGSVGHGCNNSSATGGALLSVSGVASLAGDTVLLSASSEKPTALSIVAQGTTQIAAVPFGQGLRCIGGNLKRLYTEHAVAGTFSAPTGAEPRVHTRSATLGDTILPGSSRYYYAYYRDATVLGGCSSASTFNATQSLRLIWAP